MTVDRVRLHERHDHEAAAVGQGADLEGGPGERAERPGGRERQRHEHGHALAEAGAQRDLDHATGQQDHDEPRADRGGRHDARGEVGEPAQARPRAAGARDGEASGRLHGHGGDRGARPGARAADPRRRRPGQEERREREDEDEPGQHERQAPGHGARRTAYPPGAEDRGLRRRRAREEVARRERVLELGVGEPAAALDAELAQERDVGRGASEADEADAAPRPDDGAERGSDGLHGRGVSPIAIITSMELGLATFADLSSGVSPERRMRDLLEEIRLADELGLDVFAIGEHHRPDFLVSAPAVVLGAAAAITERIRLSSAVTVLSSDDPVRVFQAFAEVDLLSGGRAEIMAGRGSFTESFPLFGFDLEDYDDLFAEKLELLLRIRDGERITWSGRLRPPLHDAGVFPRPVQEPLPVWVAVGGSPPSVVRAGALGLPLTVAIIGGRLDRFAPLVDLYREAGRRAGHDPARLRVAINTHAFVGREAGQAEAAFAAPYLAMMNRIGRERGWPPSGRSEFEELRAPHGALAAGTPEEVAAKILLEHELFGNDRYVGQMSVGAVAHRDVLRSMELFGTEVAPLVRAELARRAAA